jgi:site-specific DNA-cytosine methylase
MAERPLYTLYKNLKAQNYDVPDDYNKFESALTRDGKGGADNRHAIYENLKAQNFDVPSTYERFYSALFEPRSRTSSRAKGGSVPMSAADRARFSAGAAAISASAQQAMNNAGRYNRLKQRKKKQQKDFGRVNLGTHKTPYGGDANNVVKDDFVYNPETGKAGAYVTSDNENVYSLPEAEQSQAQDIAYQDAVDTGEIPSAFDVRDKNGNYDLQENINKNGTYLTEEGAQKQFDKKLADAYARKKEIEVAIAEDHRLHGNPLLSYGASIGASNGRTAEQSDYSNKLATSLALVNEQIGALEAVKQYPTSSWGEDALKALDNTAFTAKTWDFGLTDFATMGQMERIKTKMDNNIPLSGSDKMLLKSKLGADAAAALEDEKMGNVYRWTKIAGQSLPFMADFFLTGGYGGITKGISRGALKFAAKRGMGKVSAAILKNTGIVAGDVIGSYAMAGTEQALKTGADIMQRHLGNLYQDEQGNYKFGTFDENGNLLHEGGESMGTALYKGLTSAMVENYTEKLFGHNYGIKKGAVNFMEKHGMNTSAEFFKNIGKSGWYTNSKKWMEKFGINGFAEEVMEEEIGIPLHALLDGEGKVSDLLDAKQQLDIIGGMAISVGSMYAMGAGSRPVKGIYNRAQYYRFRNKVNVADSDAQNLMGDNWADIKDKIDNATNEQMGGVLADILRQRDTMTKEQINAAVNYGVNLMKMRGYNIAKTAEMNAKEITNESTTPEEQHQTDIDNAYSEGHDADDADKHDIQIQQEDQMKTLAAALGISEQQLSAMSDEELESLTGQDDKLDQAIYDYQLSSARYQGVVDDAQDKVDLAAHQAEQRVDMYTDQSRGSVRNSTIKASGGLEDYGVYIISGNIATHDDGSIDVSNSDDMILYYDPTTNSVEHADALMFAELGEELPADDVKAQAVADAKENAIKEVAGIIDGTVEVGSQFNVTGADGMEHTYEVLADYGDGTASISIDGNVVENPYSFEDLQNLKDLEDQKRLEAAKAQREQLENERAAQQNQETEETQPSFDFNQILNDDGNVVLVDVLDKDGNTKYPDSRLFLIRDTGAKAKVVELKSDGSLVPHAVSKKNVSMITSMSLDEYKQAMAETSMIEDNRGENRGEIEVEAPTIEGETAAPESAETPATEQTPAAPAITLEDGTIVPMLEDGNPDFSKLTAAQTAELYDTQFGEDADSIVSGYVSDAKKALDKASNMTVKGKTFVEQKAAKDAKEKAIADAQAAYDSAIAIRDAYNERQLDKVEDTAEGRKELIEKARRKFARLKSAVKDDAEAVSQLYRETIGSLLHRLYDSTGIDVTDTTPLTAEEYVASNLGAHSLNYEGTETSKGVKQETGLSREDFAKTQLLAADGKGTTIDALVHSLWENRPSNLESLDTQDIRNVLIGVLNSGFKASEARNFVENIRIAQAENILEEQKRAQENAAYAEQHKAESEAELKAKSDEKAELKAKSETKLDNESDNESNDLSNKSDNENINDNINDNINTLTPEQQKAKEDGEKLGFPAFDKEGEPINEYVVELAEWAKEQGLEIDPTSKWNNYADLFIMCKDGFGVGTLVPDRGESINQVVYFPDNVQGFDQLWKLHEEFNVGRDLKHSADMDNEQTQGAMFYDGDTAREFKEFVDKKVEEQNKVFGEQRPEEDLPFSAKENGKQQTTAERAADVEKNKVDDMKVVDNIVGEKTRKAFERLAKMMGANIQWQYSDKLGNGWIQETKDADGNVHRTIFITLDSSITEGAQFIFGHEMTHQIKNLNPAAYNELTQLVIDSYGSDAFDKAVDETMKRYSDAGFSGRARDYYAEEVVADAVGEMIRDINLAHTLAMKMSHPLLAAIHEILLKIKLAFYGTEYSDVTKNIIRSIEQAYVKTANGEVTNSETGEDVSFSLRQKPEPKKKGIGYKVFVLKDGKLYPPMVSNPNGAATPVGVWLDADAAPIAGESKTGRPQVKQGGKGTQGGSGKLAYRPGWHLGVVPYAIQFNRKDAEGNKTLFPKNFVFAEVEYAADVDYQEEARQEGINPSGKYQHSLAGLKHLPTDGFYMYRTNPNPETDPWVITGAMKVNRILTRAEQAELVKNAGREPQQIQEGDIVTDDVVNSINQEIADAPKFSLKVYHGSGADFTEFDFDHMGEGAGSQVFGWGGYVTSSEEIGKSYANLSRDYGSRNIYKGDIPLTKLEKAALSSFIENNKNHEGTFKEGVAGSIERQKALIAKHPNNPLSNSIKKRIEVLEGAMPKLDSISWDDFVPSGKNLYEVDIPEDNGSNYLEWEKKPSDEVATKIIEGLYGLDAKTLDDMASKDIVFRTLLYDYIKNADKEQMIPLLVKTHALTRETTYDNGNVEDDIRFVYNRLSRWMGSQKAASQFLSSLGFTGIKYPAGTIMGGVEGDEINYVIFKPEDMKITEHTKFSIKTYHGSQASFDKFDHSFMGSGEGAQAYGWGTYVSEVEGIAKAYAKANAKKNAPSRLMYQGKPMTYKTPSIIYQVALDMDKFNISAKEAISKMIDADEKKLASVGDTPFAKMKAKQVQDELKVLKDLNPSDFKINEDYDTVAQDLIDTKSGLDLLEDELKDAKSYVDLYQSRLDEAKEELSKAKESGTGLGVDMYESDVEYYSEQVKRYKQSIKTKESDIKDVKTKVDALQKKLDSMEKPRNLYSVDIPDDTGRNYIGWDEPLGAAKIMRLPKVFKADGWEYKKVGMYDTYKIDGNEHEVWLEPTLTTGKELYRDLTNALGSDKAASEFLSKAGFVGVKVIAQRNTGGNKEGKMNYVIFDENNAQITSHTKFSLKKDGLTPEIANTPVNIVDADEEHGFKNYAEAREWAKKNIVRTYNDEETGGKGEINISNTAVGKYLSEKAVKKSANKDVHMSVLKVLPSILRESVDAIQHVDRNKVGNERSEDFGVNPDVMIHRCYGAVNIGDKVYGVKITLKENVRTHEKTKLYSYEATKIELLDGQSGDVAMTSPRNSNNSITVAKIIKGFETTKKNGEKFSLKDEKTLAGVHNITEEKLRKALKLGGFANPSLAVIDTNKTAHDNFGEISFIAPSALLDKRTGNTGGTWITDAYTQRYPSVEREMSEKGYRKFEDWVDSLDYPSGAKAEIERQAKDALSDNNAPAWELMYLKEKGIDIKEYDSRIDYRWKEIISDHPTAEDILNSMKTDPELNKKVTSLAKHAIIHPTWEKVSLEVRRKMYKETGVKASPINPQVRKQTKEIFERDYAPTLLNKDGSPRKKDVKKVVGDIVKEHNDTKKYDFYLSKVKASNYVNKNGLYDDYIRWQENKLDEFGTKNRIFRGYTKDGSRKYVPETLENVSKAMREEADGQTNGSEYTSFGSFIAKLASRVDSTDEMRANKDKLSSNKDKEEFYEKWNGVYYDLAKFLYNDVFYGEQRLHDIVLQSDPKKYAKKEYGITLTPTFMKKLDALKNAVQTELKSAYFETKYNRPLRLNEFAAAVVPNNLGDDVRKGISDAGLPMYDYDPKKDGDRSRAFNEAINSSDNIRFSLKDEKEKIVADAKANGTYMIAPNGEKTKLDAEQWATVRTTNFKNWFGDWENDPENASKVVDENGEPLVAYHGTTNDETTSVWNEKTKMYDTSHEPFTVFKREVDGLPNSGLFFNSSEDNAYEYGYNNYAVYLSAKNPLVIDCKGSLYNSIKHDGKTMDTYDWANWAEENGYDGVIFKNIKDGVDYGSMQYTTDDYVVFKSNQIKSAENNNGDFSADNNDIRFSLKSMMAKPEGWKRANKKAIHIAEAIERDPKFSLKNLDGTLIKAGTYFSGGGLVEEGLKGIIDPVVAVEYDEKISGVYRNNFGQHIVTADVRDVDPKELVKQIDGEVEYFHASPVCKNYSQAKNNHAEVELDKETAASTAEFINSVKPKVVTIENVKGYKDSDAMKTITDALDANGYTWDADVYNAADFGGYTNRERLIARAVRDGKLPAKPKKMEHKSGWYEAVADIIPTLTEKKNGVANWMDVRLKADGIDWRNIDKPLYVMGSAYADGKIPHAFADELLPTLRTKSGDVIVMPDGKVYRAMGRVLARVSGVSDDYKMPFSENLSHTIIGNGIPTQLTEHVIAPLLTGSDPKFSIRTYHGTGASFDKFDFSHMGEGEGSQAFGWGGYVTNSKDIAEDYTRRAKIRKDNGGFEFVTDMSANNKDMVRHYIYKYKDVDKGLDAMRKDLSSALEMFPDDDNLKELSDILAKKNEEIAVPDDIAYLYDVDIPDDNGDYLDWENKLKKSHLNKVNKELVRIGKEPIEAIYPSRVDGKVRGQDLYDELSSMLGSKEAASKLLSDAGFVGIKYPAGTIFGGAKKDDYNYVIFDENNANIVGNTRFSLRYDQFEHDLNQWKKDNNLPKDAQRPTIPQRNAGESAVDFLKRVDEYRKQMALWKTAPTYEQHLLSDDTALGEFNRELQRGSVLKRIAFQDSMLAIRKAQEAIMKEVGVDRLNMAEDAYTAENRSHGKGKNEFEEYNNEFLQPLRKAYHQMKKILGDSYDNVRIYMMAKHGLERDAQMAFKKSLDADFEDVAQRSAAYRAYKGDMNRITNDSDLEFGRVDFNTWRQRDNALRTKYSPSYMDYRYDENGIAYDYSGLSALFGGSDFEEAAHKLVRDIESSHVAEVQDLWNATNAATKKILRDGYKAGMMSKDTYLYVRDMYSHYIPLRGWDGTTADQVWDYVGGGKGAFNQTLKTAHGRTSIADDPIAYIENMAESGILLNNKNWVKQHLMLLAQNHPTSLLTLSKAWYVKSTDANGNEEWIPATPQITSQMNSNQVKATIDAFEQKMENMAQTGDATQQREGLNIAYPQTHSEEREHEVRVMKDGEEYVIYVNGDPQLAQAMNNTRAHRVREIQSGKLDRAAAWLGRKMAAAYTSLSPLFIPSNYFRDLTMTLASTAIREDGRYNYLLRKNLATSWNLGFMLRDYQNGKLRDKVNNGNATPKEQMFYDFMMNGGETGFVSSLDVEDLKKKFKNDLKDLDRWKANPVKVGHTIMDSIEFLNRMIEDSNRFAVYMTSIQYGRSIDEAVNDAKDVTLNFNRKGTGEYGWQMIRNLYLFINPAVQSLQTLGALAKHHPFKFTAVTASWLASGVLVPIVNAALMSLLGGDDDKDKYWQFTKWDRRNNLIMWVPFTHEYVKIPLAQEFRAFYGVGDMIASKMMGGELAEESWSQYAEDLLGQVVDMLPLDPTGYDGNIAVSLMPNAIRPVFELAFNVDFTGKPLFKDTEYNKYDPNFTKAYVGTPDWLVRASRMVNSIGNDYPDVQQNKWDALGNPRYNLNNPAVVDHVLSSYLGGAYTMGSQVLGLLTKSLNDRKEIKVADIPLVSKFVSNPDDRPVSKKQGDEFWDKKEYYDRASNTISKLKKQAKIDGDYSLLERFYGSEEYKTYKLYEKDVKDYNEARKKERAEESGDEYRPHQLNAEDIYNNHATPMDEFEDMKLKQLFEKLNSFKTRYDAIVDNAPNESDGYYNTNKAAIDAIDEISLDKQEISELKKGFLDDGKDAYNAEDMKQIRELRKKILAVLENANKVVVANQKAKTEK